MAIKNLTIALTGPATLTAELSGQARVTSQVVDAIITGGDARVTSQVVDAIVTGGDARVTSQVVEVVFPNSVPEQLVAPLTGSAIIGADLSGLTRLLEAAISGVLTVAADLGRTNKNFTTDLVGNASVVALFDKNLEPATSTLSLTQNASAFNELVGSTLVSITDSATIITVLAAVATDTLTLTQSAEQDADFYRSASDTLGSLDHAAQFAKTLPTETASSTLSLTDAAAAARAGLSTLALTDVAVGVIGGILESPSDTLSLTSVATGTTVLLVLSSDTLALTQAVDADLITTETASNTLNLTDLAFATQIGQKCLVIFQAPFDFLQTSIVLPCALFGDTENIVSEVALRRSMNGATQTHVKTNSNRRINYTFRLLDRQKAVEAAEFFKYYNSDKIRMTNWKGEVWKVNLLTNPIDFVKTGRFKTDVSLEFEGEILNG